jgi:hypothetical protein
MRPRMLVLVLAILATGCTHDPAKPTGCHGARRPANPFRSTLPSPPVVAPLSNLGEPLWSSASGAARSEAKFPCASRPS